MAKKTVEDDWATGWRCGDCSGWNTNKAKNCTAPQHSFAERAIKAEAHVQRLLKEEIERWYEQDYMTAEEFVDALAPMMKEYLVKAYGKEKSHPHDLATAAASFMDVYWIISDHRRL